MRLKDEPNVEEVEALEEEEKDTKDCAKKKWWVEEVGYSRS